MSRLNRIFLIVIVYAAVLTIYVFIRNTRNNDINHRLVNSLDIQMQMEIHYRMYILIMDIDERYRNSPENIKMLVGYVERLHKEVIILGNSNMLAKITAHAEDTESLRWVAEQLILVMQPIDKVSDKDTKIVILIMTKEIEYLHGSLMFLAGGGIGGIGMGEAMERAKDFKKKFKK